MEYSMINDLRAEVQIPENGILSRTMFSDDAVKIVLFGFAAGQELSAHTAPMAAILEFLEGEAELTLGEDKQTAKAGTLVHMKPKLPHGIVARTPVVMLLTMLKQVR